MKQSIVKRACSGLMAIIMLLSMLPATVFAQEAEPVVFSDEGGAVLTQETTLEAEQDVGQTTEPVVTSGDAATAEELEAALNAGWTSIRITADFSIDRTFYVAKSAKIYTEEAHTLTRAADFAGDVFVVGETAEGLICEEQVVLTLGDPASEAENLLVIDGNKDNLTVDVNGTVVFVCGGHQADLYPNVTVQNNKKTGNERSLNKEKYTLSNYPDTVGGAVGIVTDGGVLNIYGGSYTGNLGSVTEETESTKGGAFFNHGTMYVYGGVIASNSALNGGAIFNYRRLYIYNGEISNNSAVGGAGGAIYTPNSTQAVLYVGVENEVVDGKVTFSGNTSDSGAGAIFGQNIVVIENAEFTENTAKSSGGAIYVQGNLQIKSSTFSKNTSAKYGGAVYITGADKSLSIDGCNFAENAASSNGGAVYVNASAATITNAVFNANTSEGSAGAICLMNAAAEIKGTTFEKNIASGGHAGAIFVSGQSATAENVDLMMVDVQFLQNSAKQTGGALYVIEGSRVYMRDAEFKRNEALADGGVYGGGAIYATAGKLEINYANFEQNTSQTRGGAISLFTKSEAVLNNVTALANAAQVTGGFACANKSDLKIYNSKIEYNTSASNAAGIDYQAGASGALYNCVFNGNVSHGQGGAVNISISGASSITGETSPIIIHNCQLQTTGRLMM